jgi:hypothetical protein
MRGYMDCEYLVLTASKFLNYQDLYWNFALTSKNNHSVCLASHILARRKYNLNKLVLYQSIQYFKRIGFDDEGIVNMKIVDKQCCWHSGVVRNYKIASKIVTEYENIGKKIKI